MQFSVATSVLLATIFLVSSTQGQYRWRATNPYGYRSGFYPQRRQDAVLEPEPVGAAVAETDPTTVVITNGKPPHTVIDDIYRFIFPMVARKVLVDFLHVITPVSEHFMHEYHVMQDLSFTQVVELMHKHKLEIDDGKYGEELKKSALYNFDQIKSDLEKWRDELVKDMAESSPEVFDQTTAFFIKYTHMIKEEFSGMILLRHGYGEYKNSVAVYKLMCDLEHAVYNYVQYMEESFVRPNPTPAPL